VRLRFRIRPPASARAVERTLDVESGRPALTLGRESGADIPLPFTTVSARHARLTPDGDGWSLADLGSANGTFLTGRRLRAGEAQPLGAGQSFKLADVEVFYEGPVLDHRAGGAESTATLARRLVSDLFGSCRPAEVARVVVVGGPDEGRELALVEVGRSYQVGRASSCALVLGDDDVSREHAAFERRWNGVEVRDLDSKNGVELAGARLLGPTRLRDGDEVVVGATRLRLDDPEERYLRQMQDEAARPGSTLVPTEEPAREETPPPVRAIGPRAITAVAIVVLAGLGALVVWFLFGL
jgi:pSer/pThr/pTyr-binding forkhead associated (FHA) protein